MVSKCQVQGRYDLHSMHLVLVANYETPPATTHVVVPTVAVYKRMHRARAERTKATLSPASLRNDIVISPIAKSAALPRSIAVSAMSAVSCITVVLPMPAAGPVAKTPTLLTTLMNLCGMARTEKYSSQS